MDDPVTLLAVAATFFIAGSVKGVIGLGLPTVCLAILTVVLDLTSAMALLLVPSFVTNVWQASVGGNGRAILKRLWPFLVMATVTVWIGVLALSRVDTALLSALLGMLLITYAAVNLLGARLSVPAAHEAWVGPMLGTANGILTGMTGSFVVPGVMFLQAIGLGRDMLIQSMGMLFTVSTVALAAGLGGGKFLTAELGLVSALGLIPAVAGMVFGQRIRSKLSESQFRIVFFWALLALGGYIVYSALA